MDYSYIKHKNDNNFLEFVHELGQGNSPIGFDTETTGLDCFTDKILLLQFCVNKKIFMFDAVELSHSFLDEVIRAAVDSKRMFIGHNIKFDLKFVYKTFSKLILNTYDTMITEVLINAGVGKTTYSLASLVEKYCGVTLDKEVRKDFFTDFNGFTQENLLYSAMDVAFLTPIYEQQLTRAYDQKLNRTLDLECRLVPVVAMMEYWGVPLDIITWKELADKNHALYIEKEKLLKETLLNRVDFSKYKNALQAIDALIIPEKRKGKRKILEAVVGIEEIKAVVMSMFNVGSTYQVTAVLNLTGVPVENTNEKTLKDIRNKYDIVDTILEFREVEKAEDTYGYSFLENINPVTGRIHTEYFNIGAATGRFSSSRPNLQNIKKESEYRSCFVAGEGKSLIAADFSQQEYRLVGAVSKEPVIIQAYKDGLDMHFLTAMNDTGKSASEITKEDRNRAKGINFAIIYGSSEYGLAYNLKIPVEKGKEILEKFYGGYPTLSSFKKAAEDMILKLKYSVTPLGRRRYFEQEPPFADSYEIYKYRRKLCKEGFNHIIQGGGADITKISLVDLFYNNPFGDKFKILLQVHDEIVVEVDDDIKDEALTFVIKTMEAAEQPFLGEIPAKVDGQVAKYWVH